MPEAGSPPRNPRPIWLTLSLVLAGTGLVLSAWLAWFLASFDLNNYRSDIERRAEQLLGMPVSIGSIAYRLHGHSLSLYGRNLQIGDVASGTQAVIPEIWLDLRWSRLLRRELAIGQLTLKRPAVHYRIGKDESTETRSSLPQDRLRSLAGSLSIKNVELIDGELELTEDTVGIARVHRFGKLQGTLSAPGEQKSTVFEIAGHVLPAGQRGPSDFSLRTELAAAAKSAPGFELSAAELAMKNIDLAALLDSLPLSSDQAHLAGRADLRLTLNTEPDRGVRFRFELAGDQVQVSSPLHADEKIPLTRLEASAIWRQEDDWHIFDNFDLDVDGNRLSGAVHWATKDANRGRVLLETGQLPVASFAPWLPVSLRSRLPDMDPQYGQILLEQGVATCTPATEERTAATWHIESLRGAVQEVRGAVSKNRPVRLAALHFNYSAGRLSLHDGAATLDRIPLAFQGSIDLHPQQPAHLQLALQGSLPAEMATEYLREQFGEGELAGDPLLRGELDGTLDSLKFDLSADLGGTTLTAPDRLRLQGTPGNRLQLHGTITDKYWRVDHAVMNWSAVHAQGQGVLPFHDPERLTLQATIRLPDLADLGQIAPHLADLNLHGQAELTLRHTGPLHGDLPEMTVELRDAGLKTGGVVADLSQLNGQIKVTREGLQADRLRGNIGTSPFVADLQLTDFSDPQIEARIDAAAIRADELIFSSDRRKLHDIKGRLLFANGRLTLDPVTLTLANGTNPEIYGTIVIGKPTLVELDIRADYADISDIIALWTDRSQAGSRAGHRPGHNRDFTPPQVTIRARVEQGNLFGMQFQSAVGTITPTPQRVIIHPLDFRVGDGYCNAQVLVEAQPEDKALLRISGHAEEIDALTVYRELLRQKNIVRGRLRGDFSLQGLAGSNFLPSSYGEFQVEIKDGVLHKFKTLSKVFSLLNVSQLFNFQLPDMDREGMPFSRITGHFTLSAGLLASDDLTIHSNAMNQSFQGSFHLIDHELDLIMAVQPLGTVDKIVSRLPVAGWLLTGEEKALLTTHFTIKGPVEDVRVTPVPVTSLSGKAVGLIRRTLGLPLKLIDDPAILWGE
ncbi:MAG: AsmA-like C-terminal domain-containing protein [Desulfuromonadales bacterium]|nr:AsmA-like C-terminal domain-containing protein [Desulfuromonadales bacterium]